MARESNDIFISVIIPVYNAEEFLSVCLDSLIAQTYSNYEVIMVNDGSTDNSVNIINQYQERDSRIKLFHQENAGPSAARNEALKHASGDYIMKLDADDFVSPNYMESAVKRINETGADGVISDMYLYIDDNNKIQHEFGNIDLNKDTISGRDALIKSITWDSTHSYLLINVRIYEGLSYDTSGQYGDEITERKLIARCNELAYSTGIYYYRYNTSSITNVVSLKRFDLCLSYVQIKNLMWEHNVMDDDVATLIAKKMYGALTSMQYFYFKHKKHLSTSERHKAQEKLHFLFENIDIDYLIAEYKQKGWLNLQFFKLKMSSIYMFRALSRMLYLKLLSQHAV